MNPYTKAAQFVIRMIGLGGIIISAILLIGNLMLHLSNRPTEPRATLFLEAVPFLVGVVVLCYSTHLARRFTRDLSDEDNDE